MKYRVSLQSAKISDKDRKVEVTAVSAKNAMDIAEMRYKVKAVKAVRLGGAPSTIQTLTKLCEDFIQAKDEGNQELASRCQKTYYSTLVSLQQSMDVVAFNMARKCIPDLPPMGK